MGVASAEEHHVLSQLLQVSYENVSGYVCPEMRYMHGPVRVGQPTGHEDLLVQGVLVGFIFLEFLAPLQLRIVYYT
jgi:hypothetical protein